MARQIDDEADAGASGLEVRESLGEMDGSDSRNRLQLDNHPPVDEEVQAVFADDTILILNSNPTSELAAIPFSRSSCNIA